MSEKSKENVELDVELDGGVPFVVPVVKNDRTRDTGKLIWQVHQDGGWFDVGPSFRTQREADVWLDVHGHVGENYRPARVFATYRVTEVVTRLIQLIED